jgi:hypothetical protein
LDKFTKGANTIAIPSQVPKSYSTILQGFKTNILGNRFVVQFLCQFNIFSIVLGHFVNKPF